MNEPGQVTPYRGAQLRSTPRLVGLAGYLTAAVCVVIALALRWSLDPLWGDRFPYIPFFLAVLVVAQFAEAGPSIFAIVMGFLFGHWFFVSPRHSLLISTPIDRFNTVFFFFISFVVLWFSLRWRGALAREQAAREELRQNVEALRESEARYSSVVENSMDAILMTDPEGRILSANREACRMFGRTEAELKRTGRMPLVDSEDGQRVAAASADRERKGKVQLEVTFVRSDGTKFTGEVSSGVFQDRDGLSRNSSIIRDVTERRRAEEERERLMEELQAAVANVKTLSGLLPICARCKKIRDDKGYWNQIELYIRDRSDAKFTHGICPDCAKLYHAELFRPAPASGSPPGAL
jgi:PAS domain S-box-containing protein